MRDLLKLKETFSEQGILISFNGEFTHGIIEEIGNAVKRYLEGAQLDKGSITDVFAVYVEQTQNVRNYLSKAGFLDPKKNEAIVVIGNADGDFQVCSGNTIERTKVEALKTHIETINSLDKDGLKKLYKETLRRPHQDDSQGAGLGLIEIARRSNSKLLYEFRDLDADCMFFSLVASVRGA